MLNYVKRCVRDRRDLRGEVTIRGGDQVGHDGHDDTRWMVRSCLAVAKPLNSQASSGQHVDLV